MLEPPAARPLDASRDPLPPRLRPDARLGVLDVSKWFAPGSGGARTYLLQKAAYVASRPSLRQVLVVPGARDLVGDGDGVRCYQLRSPRAPGMAPYRLLLRGGALRRIARHERPTVIEAGSPLLVPWLAARAARALGVPLVAYHHGLLPHAVAAAGGRPAYAAAAAYLRRLDRMFAATLAGSEYAAAELRAAGVDRAQRAPLGVELARFHPRRRAHAAETRRRLGLPHGPLVGFAGRLAPEKRLDVLLRAWPSVSRATGATLVIAGDGPWRERLRALAPDASVHWLPFEPDRDALADLLAALDVYVSPGDIETFGLAALEALASGTPVLSADRGGGAELVERSGGGALFAAGRAASLAEAAVALLRADLAALGRRARDYAEREHGWDAAFDRIFALYASLVGDGPPH